MARTRIFRTLIVALLALLVASCGGGGGSSSGSTVAENSASAAKPGVALGSLRMQFALLRAIPSTVEQIRVSGFDSQGQLQFGPRTVTKASVVEFDDVPVTVVTIQFDLLKNGVVVGTGSRGVVIEAGATTTIEDPDFVDVEVELTSLNISGPSGPFPRGVMPQFQALGTFADATQRDLTQLVTWTVAPSERATVSSDGTLSTLGVGEVTLSADFSGVSNSRTVSISAAEVVSLSVLPPSVTVAKGLDTSVRAVANYTDNTSQDVTEMAVWASLNTDTAGVEQAGTVSGNSVGDTTVNATFQGATGEVVVNVTPAVVVGLQVNPVELSLAKGTGQSYQAVATLSDSTQLDVTEQVQWTVSQQAVAAIDSTGRLTALNTGATDVAATLDSLSAQAALVVTPAEVVSLQLSPQGASLADGTTVQMELLATFTDQTRQDVTAQANWSSLSPDIATVDLSGLVTGQSVGMAGILATFQGVSEEVPVTVTEATVVSLSIAPSPVSLPAGLGEAFTATAVFTNQTSQNVTPLVNWSSSSPGVASVDTLGNLSTYVPGETVVSATYESLQSEVAVTVSEAELTGIVVTPESASLVDGLQQGFAATGFYTDGTTQDITGQVAWSSADTSVATIDTLGVALGEGVGETTITARSGLHSGESTLQVSEAELVSLEIEPLDSSLPKGLSLAYTAFGTFTNGERIDVTSQATWNSAMPSVATMSLGGEATAVEPGQTTISALLGTAYAETSLTVGDAVVVSVSLDPQELTIAVGGDSYFSAVATYSDSTILNLNGLNPPTWLSTDESIATITNSARVTALAEGSCSIKAVFDGVEGSALLTVVSEDILPVDDVWNSTIDGDQVDPSVDATSPGGFMVVWQGPEPSGEFGVFGKGSNSDLEEVKVNVQPSSLPTMPDVAVASNAGFLVCWRGDDENGNSGIWFRIFNSSGEPVTGQVPLSSFAGPLVGAPRAVALNDDMGNVRYVVVWQDEDSGDGSSTVVARRIEADGSLHPMERFVVAENLLGDQIEPEISRFSNFDFIVSWSGNRTGDFDIYARRLSAQADGIMAISGEVRVNASTAGDQTQPSVSGNVEGDFAVSWTSRPSGGDSDVAVRRFKPDNTPWEADNFIPDTNGDDQVASSAFVYPRYPQSTNPPNVNVVYQSPDEDGEGVYSLATPTLPSGRFNQTFIHDQVSPALAAIYFISDTETSISGGGTFYTAFEGHDGPNSRGILFEYSGYAFFFQKWSPSDIFNYPAGATSTAGSPPTP